MFWIMSLPVTMECHHPSFYHPVHCRGNPVSNEMISKLHVATTSSDYQLTRLTGCCITGVIDPILLVFHLYVAVQVYSM